MSGTRSLSAPRRPVAGSDARGSAGWLRLVFALLFLVLCLLTAALLPGRELRRIERQLRPPGASATPEAAGERSRDR